MGFRDDSGWNPAPRMRAMPDKVYNKVTTPGPQNVNDVVTKHLRDGSFFPIPPIDLSTETGQPPLEEQAVATKKKRIDNVSN